MASATASVDKKRLLTHNPVSATYTFGMLSRRDFRLILMKAEAYCLTENMPYLCREDRSLFESRFVLTAPGIIHRVIVDHLER